jgi:hypothetical protein
VKHRRIVLRMVTMGWFMLALRFSLDSRTLVGLPNLLAAALVLFCLFMSAFTWEVGRDPSIDR